MNETKSPLHEKMLTYGMVKLARKLKVSQTTLYRWVELDHVPPRRLETVVEVLKLTPEMVKTLSENRKKTPHTPTKAKPENTLEMLEQVRKGYMDLAEVANALNLSFKSLRTAYELNKDRLLVLSNTLKAYSERRINRKQAIQTLDVSPSQFHYLMRVYGQAREPLNRPVSARNSQKERCETLARAWLESKPMSINAFAKQEGVLPRTLYRYVRKLENDQ